MSVAAEHQLTINYETEVFDPKVGDDLLLALNKKYCAMPCFHPDRLRDWADDLGYDLTSSDKSPDLRWKKLEEVQLVKRNFRFDVDTGKWMGCLDKTSIYKMVCYSTKTKVSQAERDQSAALCACKETYLHGREEYEAFKAICDANNIKCWSWEELDSAYRRDVLKVWDSGDDLESADAQETESPGRQAATIEVDSRPKESSLSKLLPDNSAGAAEGTSLDNLQHQSKDVSPDRESSMNTRSTEINSSEGLSFSSAHGTINNMGSMEAPKVDITSVTAPAKLDEETIPDRNRLAGVYRRIGTFSWSTATVTQNLDAWLSYITLAPIISNFTSQYQFFRGSPKIRVSYTGASSYLGQARVFMVPVRVQDTTSINALAQDDYTTLGTNQYARSASMPHIDLDASLSCVCELAVPYVASSEFEMSPTVNDWKIYFQPFFLAKADTTAPNTLSVTIELCYPDLCVFNLTPQGGDDSSSFLGSLLSYGKKFGRAYISPAVAVAKWGVSVAESLGFSRPPEEDMQQIVRRGFSNMSAVSGANDGVIHLGVDPRQMVDMTAANLPGPELNTFDEFLKKRNQVICSTLSAYSTGYAMGPDVFPNTFGSALEYPTPLNVYTMMFTQWRGSFTARVTVYSSPLVRMRIGVNVIPPNTAAIAGFTANGSCLSKIVEIAGTTTFDVEIPWMFPTLSVATTMVQFNSNARPRMYLWILEGPNGTAAACATPQFAVDLIPGADFEATRPTLDIWNTYLTMQGKLADSLGAKIESFTELAKRCSPVGVFRPSVLATVADSNMITLPRDLPILNAGNSMVWTGGAAAAQLEWIEVSWSFLTLIRALSYGYRGSSIFRVTVNSIDGTRTISGPVTTPTWFSLSKTYSQIGAGLTTVGTGTLACGVPFVGQGVQYFENGVIEVSVPDYALERFTNTMIGGVPTAVLITDSVTMGIRPASLTNGVAYQVSYAAGDDVRFGMYMPPCITLRL